MKVHIEKDRRLPDYHVYRDLPYAKNYKTINMPEYVIALIMNIQRLYGILQDYLEVMYERQEKEGEEI